MLFVNNIRERWSWEVCAPNLSACSPFGAGREITTAGASAETVFRVSGGGETGLSPIWHGNLSLAAPPSVRGPLRANELVVPVPAIWTGGWDGDFDQAQLSVCETPAGGRCMSITDPKNPEGCRREAAVLDPTFVGGYLRIADMRYGPGTIFTLEGRFPFGQEIWEASGNTAVAIVGRVEPADGPRTAKCGPPPIVPAIITKQGIASVRCPLSCRAVLTARRRGRVASVGRRFSGHPPTPFPVRPSLRLRIPQDELARFGTGRVRMSVEIDGRRVARRTVFLGGGAQPR
ncbi:MAG TPA: hypothetical protein VF729_07550 [Solirubrobacterales bacterium]